MKSTSLFSHLRLDLLLHNLVMIKPMTIKCLSQEGSAHNEVCGLCSEDENARPTAQADEVLRSPGVEASPPSLQTLCWLGMNAMQSKSSFRGNVDFLKKAQESQPPQFPK